MIISSLVATLVFGHLGLKDALAGNMFWEEEPAVQKVPGYHPMLRFNPGNTYMFSTPYFVQQGKYQVVNNRYQFKAITAYELENAEKFKLQAELNPDEARKFDKAYTLSMRDFTAEYNERNHTLFVDALDKDTVKTFRLYAISEGDSARTKSLHEDEVGLDGIWHAPDPFPERMNCRERFKFFGLEGLEQFFKEAMNADGAQLTVMDLRVDRSYRFHSMVGMWKRDGAYLVLTTDGPDVRYRISDDGLKLMQGNKVAFVKF